MHIRDILNIDLAKISQYVDKSFIDKIIIDFERWKKKSSIKDLSDDEKIKENLLLFLLENIKNLYSSLEKLDLKHNEFRRKFSKAQNDDEKKEIVIKYASLNGFDSYTNEDIEALNRWMYDDAVDERFDKIKSDIQKELKFYINRSGVLFLLNCSILNESDTLKFWKQIDFIEKLKPLLNINTQKSLLSESLNAITKAISSIKNFDDRTKLIEEQEIKFIYRLSLEDHQDVWIQVSALELLYQFSIDSFLIAATRRLSKRKDGDDIFVRHRIFIILSTCLYNKRFYKLLDLGVKDTSAFVKQGVLKAIVNFNDEYYYTLLEDLLFNDSDDSVKAEALESLNKLKIPSKQYIKTLESFLKTDASPFILRYAMDNICLYIESSSIDSDFSPLVEQIETIENNSQNRSLRRYAREYLEKINFYRIEKEDLELKKLKDDILNLKDGESLNIDKHLCEKDQFCRFLSVLTLDNFSLELKKGLFFYKIYKGEKITQKLWRFIYETRYTSPDKREGYDHTQGRHHRGEYIFLTNKLAEVTPTKVIGEPVHISQDGGWMGYLPLPSHILFAISRSIFGKNELRLFTSQGETIIKVESFYLKRFFLLIWSNFNFSKIANERADVIFENKAKNSYFNFLNSYGIRLEFKSYNKKGDKSILEYFRKDLDV